MSGLLADPAFAAYELEHDSAKIEEVRSGTLPAGYADESQVCVWGWGSGLDLYWFMGFCYNDGGYWYWGGDWYWHTC